jgi:nitrogen fixation protein NifB
MKNFENHPCFNPEVKGKFGRVHLPVAPKCNVQCRFCNRKYDCVNESRPGVTSNLLSPGQALHYVTRLLDMGKPISVAGIAGPGDPFANPEETMETMRLLRRKLPDLLLCVSSNGLGIGPHIPELAEIGVSHVTITISAIDPEIGQHVYAWIRDGKKVYRGVEAAERMIAKQLDAVRQLKEFDLVVKVNTVLIPGVNEDHVVAIAEKCKEMGVDLHNVIPLTPVEGTPFEDLEEPSKELVHALRKECGDLVPQMTHCQRCRADSCGLLSEGTTQETMDMLQQASNAPINPDEDRPYVAVATREGVLVNLHLGEAEEFQIYGEADGEFVLVDTRKSPPRGCGEVRWQTMARWLNDCRAVLVSSAGPKPTEALLKEGVKVIVMEGLIDEALSAIYAGQEIKAPVRDFKCGAGAGCTGDGGGCG